MIYPSYRPRKNSRAHGHVNQLPSSNYVLVDATGLGSQIAELQAAVLRLPLAGTAFQTIATDVVYLVG